MNCWHRRCLLQSRLAVARRDLCRSSRCRNIYLQVFYQAFAFQSFSDQSAICIQEQEMLKRDLKIGFLFRYSSLTIARKNFSKITHLFFQRHNAVLLRGLLLRGAFCFGSLQRRGSGASQEPQADLPWHCFLNKKRDRRNIWRWCLFHLVKSFTQAKLEF